MKKVRGNAADVVDAADVLLVPRLFYCSFA